MLTWKILFMTLLAVQAQSLGKKRREINLESSSVSNYSPWKIHSYYLPADYGSKPEEIHKSIDPELNRIQVYANVDTYRHLNGVKPGAATLEDHAVNVYDSEELLMHRDTVGLLKRPHDLVEFVHSKVILPKESTNTYNEDEAYLNGERSLELSPENSQGIRIDPEFEHLPKTVSEHQKLDPDFEHLPSVEHSRNYWDEDSQYEFPTHKSGGTETYTDTFNYYEDLHMPEISKGIHSNIHRGTMEISDEYYFDNYVNDAASSLSDQSSNKSPDMVHFRTTKQSIMDTNEVSSTLNPARVVEENEETSTRDELEEYDYDLGNDMIHHSLRNLFFDSIDDKFRSLVFNPVASPKEKFQECISPRNESGHCRYVQHCFLPNIVASLGNFMGYVCIIQERFIGICCPEFPVHSLQVQWTLPANELEDDSEENITQPEGGCGISSKTRIVGGTKADPKEYPWMAALISETNGKFFCGGSLINSKYVLTAAHCTFSVPRNKILVRLGEYDFSDSSDGPGEDYPVVEIKRHAQFSRKTLRNDIALLKLARAATFSPFISTICLPESNELYIGQIATLAGWGNTIGGGAQSEVLLEISIPVWSNSECSVVQGIPIRNSFICAGARTKDKGACNGDSGGPLMLLDESAKQWKTIGVVSWGRIGCDPSFPTVFTRVSHYLDWIEMHSSN